MEMTRLASPLSSRSRPVLGIVIALLGPAGLALVLLPFQGQLDGAVYGLAFLLPAVVATSVAGTPVAALSVVVGFAVYNFLFTQPYYTFAVAAIEDVVGLVAYVIVGLVIALAVQREQRASREAARVHMLEEVDRMRDALMSAVSHDLRTPLASISAAAAELTDMTVDYDETDRRMLLDTIGEQARRLDRLVANILDVGRLESGTMEVRAAPVGLDDLIQQARANLGRALDGHGIEIVMEEPLPPVLVDATLIVQVLTNLLDNALRYSPDGAPIHVRAKTEGNMVALHIEDDGAGFDEEVLSHPPHVGVGRDGSARRRLGLAISRGYVEAHGGVMRLSNARGGGACVEVGLPLAPPPHG